MVALDCSVVDKNGPVEACATRPQTGEQSLRLYTHRYEQARTEIFPIELKASVSFPMRGSGRGRIPGQRLENRDAERQLLAIITRRGKTCTCQCTMVPFRSSCTTDAMRQVRESETLDVSSFLARSSWLA